MNKPDDQCHDCYADHQESDVYLCAMHKAAPALLEAAKAMLARIENITSDEFSKGGDQAERVALYAAIKLATD